MIYYGLRSTRRYLSLLEDVRISSAEHRVCSVIGGLAFLHALGERTADLTLVDTDSDAFPHCKLILKLIEISSSLKEFLSFLSCHEIKDDWRSTSPFERPLSHLNHLSTKLDTQLLELYRRTYARMRFHSESGNFRIDESTIKFFGFDLTPMTYCWHFGAGNFSSEDRFQILRAALQRIKINYLHTSLDVLDYGVLFPQDDGPLVLLASNCDSHLFTSRDSIFRRVLETARGQVRYVSWVRDLSFDLRQTVSAKLLEILKPFTQKKTIYGLRQCFPSALSKESLEANEIVLYEDLAKLKADPPYGGSLFIYGKPGNNKEFSPGSLSELLETLWPSLRQIAVISAGRAGNILLECENETFHKYYQVRLIEWAAENCVILWELRGNSRFKNASKFIT